MGFVVCMGDIQERVLRLTLRFTGCLVGFGWGETSKDIAIHFCHGSIKFWIIIFLCWIRCICNVIILTLLIYQKINFGHILNENLNLLRLNERIIYIFNNNFFVHLNHFIFFTNENPLSPRGKWLKSFANTTTTQRLLPNKISVLHYF